MSDDFALRRTNGEQNVIKSIPRQKFFDVIDCVWLVQDAHGRNMLRNRDGWKAHSEFRQHRLITADDSNFSVVQAAVLEKKGGKIAPRKCSQRHAAQPRERLQHAAVANAHVSRLIGAAKSFGYFAGTLAMQHHDMIDIRSNDEGKACGP